MNVLSAAYETDRAQSRTVFIQSFFSSGYNLCIVLKSINNFNNILYYILNIKYKFPPNVPTNRDNYLRKS